MTSEVRAANNLLLLVTALCIQVRIHSAQLGRLGLGFRDLGLGFRAKDLGFRVEDTYQQNRCALRDALGICGVYHQISEVPLKDAQITFSRISQIMSLVLGLYTKDLTVLCRGCEINCENV